MSASNDKKTTIQVNDRDKQIARRLMHSLRAKTDAEMFHKLVEYRMKASHDKKLQKYTTTERLELEHEIPCSHRWPRKEGELFAGRKWCGRKLIDRPIKSIERCGTCKFRNPSKESLKIQVAIAEKRPFVISKELGIRDFRATRKHIQLQIEGNHYFWTCTPEQRYSDKGIFEVKCAQCPDEKVKGQWHPVEICKEIACPLLKPLEEVLKKPRKKGEYIHYHEHV